MPLWSVAKVSNTDSVDPLSISKKMWGKYTNSTQSIKFIPSCATWYIVLVTHHFKSFVLSEMPQSGFPLCTDDRQAIHPYALKSPVPWAEFPQSQTHYADSATGVQSYTCDSNKKTPSLLLSLSPTFPVNYHSTDRWKTAHLSSLRATYTWAFPSILIAKIIRKSRASGFWGWFPVGCKGIQMAAFKS